MKALRILLVLFSFISAFHLANMSSMLDINLPKTIVNYSGWISLLIAFLLAFLVWKITGRLTEKQVTHMLIGGIITGAVCFAGTMIGAMVMFPDCNICPIMGIFFAPAAYLLGMPVGYIIGKRRSIVKSAVQPPMPNM